VLIRASECGIDSNEICLAVYREVKKEAVLTGNESKVLFMMRSFAYLCLCLGHQNDQRAFACMALFDLQWIGHNLRRSDGGKLHHSQIVWSVLAILLLFIIIDILVMGRMAEIVELIQLAGNDLTLEVERAYAEEMEGGSRKPYELEKAQREYQGFVEYFVSIELKFCDDFTQYLGVDQGLQ
jgi:hypothetical protein